MTTPDTATHSVLIVDDDVQLSDMLEEYLSPLGFRIGLARDGEAGLQSALEGEYDLVILDVMMPVMDGFEVLRRLRKESDLPVLMLTARGDDVDRIVGLEVGADDYLGKPFNPRELVARMRAILRRTSGGESTETTLDVELPIGRLRLNEADLSGRLDDRDLELTGAEFRILSCLARRAGNIVSRAELTQQALGRRLGAFDRALDTHISNLRKKLTCQNPSATAIRSVRNAGYLLASKEPRG